MPGERFCETHWLILQRVKASIRHRGKKYEKFVPPKAVTVTHVEPAKPEPKPAKPARVSWADQRRQGGLELARLVAERGRLNVAEAAEAFGVGQGVVKRRARAAADEGWIRRQPGKGYLLGSTELPAAV
jgi:hypothetical protein